MNHIYLSYPEIESMNVCPVGHPLISTPIYGKEKCAIFHDGTRWKEKVLYEYNYGNQDK